MNYIERRAYNLRCRAEALEATQRLVTVELSEAAAWVLRDLIGWSSPGMLGAQINLQDDLDRLNAALGYRATVGVPHVSGWSGEVVKELRR